MKQYIAELIIKINTFENRGICTKYLKDELNVLLEMFPLKSIKDLNWSADKIYEGERNEFYYYCTIYWVTIIYCIRKNFVRRVSTLSF